MPDAADAVPDRLTAVGGRALTGTCAVPGDKSISHRALMLAALAVGESRITGLLEGDDVLATARAMAALGAEVTRDGAGAWRVAGRGVGGLAPPDDVLDLGNAGTGARLLLGILAGHPFSATVTGDASLRRRPMARVTEPLRRMGAVFVGNGDTLPLTVTGSDELVPIEYVLPVPSAQVKSAVLLAGLHAPGTTTVVEPAPTRDHTERLLGRFGATVETADGADGRRIAVAGFPALAAADIVVPADPSAAAFPLVAALLAPGSRVTVPGVMRNATRTGLYATLAEMGAEIAFERERDAGGERVADVTVRAGALTGVTVPAARAPTMIDEYPALAVAAACARGTTRMAGLGELRVKESDRLLALAVGLAACGVAVEADRDSLVVHGTGAPPDGGAVLDAALDHRIAMAFLVLGLASTAPVTVAGCATIATSFPGFARTMRALGADIADAS